MTTSSHAHPASAPLDGARVVKIPPPAYYVAAFAAGRGLNVLVPWPVDVGALRWVGVGVIVAGAALAVAGVVGVTAHRTTIVPHRPVSTLVHTGAYAISRNPMYTGLAIAYVGLALATDSWWPLVTLPCALAAIRWLVIAPEEAYLDRRYPAEFRAYRSRVRRWL